MTDPKDKGSSPAVVAVIPARGGSKGVPRKNLRDVAGRPLVVWSIADGLESKRIGRVYVSTEDAEIQRVAQQAGAALRRFRADDFC